jgi:hypothetical protein
MAGGNPAIDFPGVSILLFVTGFAVIQTHAENSILNQDMNHNRNFCFHRKFPAPVGEAGQYISRIRDP